MVRTGRTIRKKVITALVLPPKPEDFAPLIVVGNQKSGNSDCANNLAAFRRQLNPSQVLYFICLFIFYDIDIYLSKMDIFIHLIISIFIHLHIMYLS